MLAELPPRYLKKTYPFRLHLPMPPQAELAAVLDAAARAGGSRRWQAWRGRAGGAEVLIVGFMAQAARSVFGAWVAGRSAQHAQQLNHASDHHGEPGDQDQGDQAVAAGTP